MNRENKRKQYEKGYYTHACNETFVCKVCERTVVPQGAGSDHRNHCPNCLSSLHVDIEPGDRASDCGGIMDPIAVWVRKNGEWAIVHRCRICGALSSNRVVPDRAYQRADGAHGRRRGARITRKKITKQVFACSVIFYAYQKRCSPSELHRRAY